MVRKVNHHFGAIAEHWMKIQQASLFSHDGMPVWIVKLTIGKGQWELDGWVFVEPQYMELRFESCPTMAPPGFLSGRYLAQGLDDSSLAFLFDNPCEEDVANMEKHIRSFIEKCRFCVRTLTDIAKEMCWQEVTSYRYGIATIPIRKGKEAQ